MLTVPAEKVNPISVPLPDSPAKENFDFFDLLKAVAIFFVVIYHFNYLPIDFRQHPSFETYSHYFVKGIFSTCVPLFFLINGALLLNKPTFSLKRHAYKTLKIAVLAVLWAAITLVALSLIRQEPLSGAQVVKGVWQIKKGWIDHIWFLEALVGIYLFFPLLSIAFWQHRKSFYFFLAGVLVFTFGNTLLSNFLVTASFLAQKFVHANLEVNYFGDFNAFRGIYGFSLGYFMVGGLVLTVRRTVQARKYRWLALAVLPVSMLALFGYGIMASIRHQAIWDIVWNGYDTVFTLVNVFALFILSLGYTNRGLLGKGIALVGRNSLGIYFTHVVIGAVLEPYFTQLPIAHLLLPNVLYALLILGISLLSVLALKQVPVLKNLLMV